MVWIVFALFLAVWQVVGAFNANAYYVSSPLEIGRQLLVWGTDGYLWPHLLASVESTLAGFVVAAVLAISLALAIASSPRAGQILEPFLLAAFSTPKIVVAPLLIFWVGVGSAPVIVLAALSSFFVIFYGAYGPLRDVPRGYFDTAAVLGAGAWTTATRFRLPAAAPEVLAGLQQGLIYAFHGAVLGEMTASNTGMGYVIMYSATSMDSASVLAALAVIGAVSFVLTQVLGRAAQNFSDPLTVEAMP